jgi:hypothetical protein
VRYPAATRSFTICAAARSVIPTSSAISRIREVGSADPAKLVPNPLPKREEIRPFETWAEVEAVAEEIGPTGRS